MNVTRRGVLLLARGRGRGRYAGVLLALAFCLASAATVADAKHDQAAEAMPGDPLFTQPYVDIDEWRDQPVRHRYVHGGFKGTETRFSFYFPPKAEYQGRFFQHITPVPDSENLAQKMPPGEYNKIGFSISSGAYFVETNGGGHLDLGKASVPQGDSSISAYRANAAAAQYSRIVALQMYGGKRPYGYAYGGSGGGYRTIGAMENTKGVWEGAVPYVIGSTMAIPNTLTVRMHAMRVLHDKFPQIVDAMEPGGSGNPYAGLDAVQTEALREVTGMGFPPQSWFGYKTMGVQGFAALYPGVVAADPSYFSDFWTKAGYLGFDHPEQFIGARVQHKSVIAATVSAAEAARLRLNIDASHEENRGGVDSAFRVPVGAEGQRVVGVRLAAAPPPVDFIGGDLIVSSGAAAGKVLPLAHIAGDIVVLGVADASVAALLAPGDEVQVDNSKYLAAQTYHRHQVPTADFKVWDQFRGVDGKPLYPQRPMLLGPLFVKATAGSLQTGQYQGKMIVVASLWDREAFPWQADWYRSQVERYYGDKTNDHFRLWYTDHALHGDEPQLEDPSRIVSYQGMLQQALRDVSAWVERGIAPPASTRYTIVDGQVEVPSSAAERLGIQPVVSLTANGGQRAEVTAGKPVMFSAQVAVPPGAGKVVAAQWDFEGAGSYPVAARFKPVNASRVTINARHSFSKPGLYFPALRVISQRQGDSKTPYARIQNLARVRIVVN